MVARRCQRFPTALFILICLLRVGVVTTDCARAQSGDLDKLNQQIYRLIAKGKYAEAVPLASRSVELTRRQKGRDHVDTATSLYWLGRALQLLERYGEAESRYKEALAIREKVRGAEHSEVAVDLMNLGALYDHEGRYSDAEVLLKRSLEMKIRVSGASNSEVAPFLVNLADCYRDEGRYREAEPLFKNAIAIFEKTLGPVHVNTAIALSNLAAVYNHEGRYAESEPLYERVLAIDEKLLGHEHPGVASDMENLSIVYRARGRYAEAETAEKRALALREKVLGPTHPLTAWSLKNLALIYNDQSVRYSEQEQLIKRALDIDEKAFGVDHPLTLVSVHNLAVLYYRQGRYTQAEPLFKRVLAVRERALPPDHRDTVSVLSNLASLHMAQGEWAPAVDDLRRSTSMAIRVTQRGLQDVGLPVAGRAKDEAQQTSRQFIKLVKAAYRLALERGDKDANLAREMFERAQWASYSDTARSLSQMAARGAKGDARLAAIVRERQDLVSEWQRRDTLRNAFLARASDKRDTKAESENAAQLAGIEARVSAIDKWLAAKFRDYAKFANSTPLPVEDVQAQLSRNEALVLFLATSEAGSIPEETFIWVVTDTQIRWVRSELGPSALSREVTALRCGLDYEAWGASGCKDLLNVTYSPLDHRLGKPLPFDLARAHALYKAIFGEVEDLIANRNLIVVPAGQLPLGVLVTEAPKTALPGGFSEYRNISWFARQHPTTYLPAVSSLKALREFAKDGHASESYIGFGNPLLDGEPQKFAEDADRAKLAREKKCGSAKLPQSVALSDIHLDKSTVTRGANGLAETADLRTWAPLPETADELCEVANDLGVDPATHVHLGAQATESEIRRLAHEGILATYRIVHFATHGVVAGELSGTAEPGLILTPPDNASELDDGYLSASEIAALKLDADWVILSACNTAAGEAKEAEALSGLARAFFYAGARSLLVSHWEVSSDSTVKLITKAVAELKADPKIGRAEALRRSMLSMIANGKSYEAHPAFWAPFVLVGEGGAGR
jgi:tetratricopeptide (TPR) repeat protein